MYFGPQATPKVHVKIVNQTIITESPQSFILLMQLFAFCCEAFFISFFCVFVENIIFFSRSAMNILFGKQK